MKNSLTSEQEYSLWVLLRLTSHLLFKARSKELSRYGISPREAAVLRIVVDSEEKATPAEISRWLFREPHSVSGLVSRMEQDGLVQKVKDLDKKNLIRVTLTEKGRQAYENSTKRDSMHPIMASLSKEERQQMISSLEKLRKRVLEELRIDYRPHLPKT